MPIKFSFLTITFLFSTLYVFAQSDSSESNSWKKFYLALRVGVGYQHSGYIEGGISLWNGTDQKMGNATLFYSTVEFNPNIIGMSGKPIFGLKIGAETYASIFAIGIEFKNLTDFSRNTYVLTPKIGLGPLGAFGLFVGWNIRDKANYFPAVGKWQVSMNANFNRKAHAQIFR